MFALRRDLVWAAIRKGLPLGVAVTAATALAALAPAPGASAAAGHQGDGVRSARLLAAGSAEVGAWGTAIEVPGTAALNKDGDAQTMSVSCPTAGNCGAGGDYEDASLHLQASVANETNGAWGTASEVPGTAALNEGGSAWVVSVSCAAADNCGAAGEYKDASGDLQVFVVNESGGVWGTAIEAPGLAALNSGSAWVTSVSCGAVGDCGAGGYYADSSGHKQAFVVSESGGVWGTATQVPGTAGLNAGGNAQILSVSCPAAGDCGAGGQYTDASGLVQALVVNESGGVWGTAIEVPGTATVNTGGSAETASVSCPAAGACTAGGAYVDSSVHRHAFVVSESGGVWGTAIEVPGTPALNVGGNAQVMSVSCASAGNCGLGGQYDDNTFFFQSFVASETNGVWGTAIEVPGTAALNVEGIGQVTSVSCATAGNCDAGGQYADASFLTQAFVVTETNGVWGTAIEVPGTADLNVTGVAVVNSVSCGAAANCAAGGLYRDAASDYQAFVADQK